MEPERPRSWWERNWKWFVPVGCVALLLLAAAGVAALFALIMGAVRSSDAYALGFARARADCGVQQALGAPVRPGWWVGGSVHVTGPSGDADLSIPLRGETQSGTLYLTATKAAGRWTFELLEVEVEGGTERIDLLAGERPTCD
jgi:hypothetical protein